MDSDLARWIVLAALNFPLYLGLGWLIFDDWAGFFRSVGFWLTPDWLSLLRGEWLDDWWETTKLLVFTALCVAAVYGEHRFFFGEQPLARRGSAALAPATTGRE